MLAGPGLGRMVKLVTVKHPPAAVTEAVYTPGG